MAHRTIPFARMEWQQGAHPLERKKTALDLPLTLLEFAVGFQDSQWCRRGHIGYILSGALAMDYEDATALYREGDAFLIEPGTAHQAHNPGSAPVRLLILSWE